MLWYAARTSGPAGKCQDIQKMVSHLAPRQQRRPPIGQRRPRRGSQLIRSPRNKSQA